jgi:diguanylate cyclase (GGDEF)-like protein
MIDVDEFKAYNDLYGHPAGDRCLRALADALASTCRSTDIAARYGGEEFAVLLPDTDCRAAASVAERMRLRVRELGLRHDGRPDGVVTISLGVAAVIPRSGETSPGRLVDAADRSLYIAKQAGRDRTHCSDDGENPSAAMPPPAPPECQQTASAPAK